ncbi:hypothetical protein D3C71_1433870 [compost metagenome]
MTRCLFKLCYSRNHKRTLPKVLRKIGLRFSIQVDKLDGDLDRIVRVLSMKIFHLQRSHIGSRVLGLSKEDI